VYNVELQPGQGGTLARSAGASVEVLANADGYTDLKLSSSEVRRVLGTCLASIGQVSNPEWNLVYDRQSRPFPLARHPPDRSRQSYEPGGPSVRRRRRQPAARYPQKPKDVWGNVTGGQKDPQQAQSVEQTYREPQSKEINNNVPISKKGPYVDPKLLAEDGEAVSGRSRRSRPGRATPKFRRKWWAMLFAIHNGKNFIEVRIREEMVGHRLGEFSDPQIRPPRRQNAERTRSFRKSRRRCGSRSGG
jgi:ribosomal protein S19